MRVRNTAITIVFLSEEFVGNHSSRFDGANVTKCGFWIEPTPDEQILKQKNCTSGFEPLFKYNRPATSRVYPPIKERFAGCGVTSVETKFQQLFEAHGAPH